MDYKPTLTISDTQMEKITDYLGYQTEIEEEGEMIDNPQGRPSFLLNKVKDYLKNCYKAEKAKEVEETRKTTLETADTELKTLEVK